MAKKNTQEHKDFLVNRINEDLDNYKERLEMEDDLNFDTEIAFAKKCLRWLSEGVKPTQVERVYTKALKLLNLNKEVIAELRDMQNSSQQ
jgi:flagellar motor component MotA